MGERVRVHGFPWCRAAPTEIGIKGLTAKILCGKHNSDLSDIDDHGGKAFGILREVARISEERKRMKPRPWKIVEHTIDGRVLERWCLKTLINLCCHRDHPIGRDSATPGRPSERLVRVAYNRESFVNRAGLYFVIRVGMMINTSDAIEFTPLIQNGLYIEGGLFTFRGYMLLLYLEPEGPPEPLSGLVFNGEDLGMARLNFHNEEINFTGGNYLSQVVRLRW
jgi:hypothetical protein